MELNLNDVTIERCLKDTEEVIAKEEVSFLNTPLNYLNQHMEEFIFIESEAFHGMKTESLSFEVDDVFKTYMVLFGFQVQKKYASTIKAYLEEHLHGENIYASYIFSGEDGLWDVNLPLNNVEGFTEEMTFNEAISLIYNFAAKLVHTIEQQ
ncbi:branched-chain amino acid aminotransferase [Lysinibacillus yapensis]|uniref:Branched-chain amino acid aminotransferase n=1 Tax=Ureibacillus yapensis TaxID=2304605 RepID=A0A396S922_9BACL|nr:branched-chain amino acid aminotransferase [Lysinibacillus yapensis]RHW37599.1 branched-chain amino acid aminotransferase [Lysinibacillus yapensis]